MSGLEEDEPPDLPDAQSGDPAGSSPMDTAPTEFIVVQRKRKAPEGVVLSPEGKKKITNTEAASASIQNVFCLPQYEEDRYYSDSDKGPFVVHICRADVSPGQGAPLSAVKLGKLFFDRKVANIVRGSLRNEGRNKCSVEFPSANLANSFVKLPFLAQEKLSAVIPAFNVSRLGILKRVPLDVSMEELVCGLDYPQGYGSVLKGRRLNRKVLKDGAIQWVPTQTVVLTFSGQALPSHVYFYYTSFSVEKYEFPIIQCLNCARFGHVKAQCRFESCCVRCGGKGHIKDSCSASSAICLWCSGNHLATDKVCPEFQRQKAIKLVMSQECVSFVEAAGRFPSSRANKSFASVVARSSPPLFSQSQCVPSPPASSSQQSYRKTVWVPRHSRPASSAGFDRAAHSSIVSSPVSELPNGSALSSQFRSPCDRCSCSASADSDQSVGELFSLLLDIITKFNKCSISLPSHVSNRLVNLLNLNHNVQIPQGPSMEQ